MPPAGGTRGDVAEPAPKLPEADKAHEDSFDPGIETGYRRRGPRDHELPVEIGASPFNPGPERYDGRRAKRAARRREKAERKRRERQQKLERRLEEKERDERERAEREREAGLEQQREERERAERERAERVRAERERLLSSERNRVERERAERSERAEQAERERAERVTAAAAAQAMREHERRERAGRKQQKRKQERRETDQRQRTTRTRRAPRPETPERTRAGGRRAELERQRREREERRRRAASGAPSADGGPRPSGPELRGPTAKAGLALAAVLAFAAGMGTLLGLPMPGLSSGSDSASSTAAGDAALLALSSGTPAGLTKGPYFPAVLDAAADYAESAARFHADRGGRKHEGQDIFAKPGTPLVAVRDGIVLDGSGGRNFYASGGGNTLVIYSPLDNRSYVYLHMLRPALVRAGDSVSAGQPVGQLGCTGSCDGPHLHFEVRNGRADFGAETKAIDPLPLLSQWPQRPTG